MHFIARVFVTLAIHAGKYLAIAVGLDGSYAFPLRLARGPCVYRAKGSGFNMSSWTIATFSFFSPPVQRECEQTYTFRCQDTALSAVVGEWPLFACRLVNSASRLSDRACRDREGRKGLRLTASPPALSERRRLAP